MTVFESVAAARARYGATVSPSEAVAILNLVAWQHAPHVSLYRAPDGGNGAAHPNGYVRLDILVDERVGLVTDVFIDGPDALEGKDGRAVPAWQEKGPAEFTRLVAPVEPAILGAPIDPSIPMPPGGGGGARPPVGPDDELGLAERFLEAVETLVDAVGGLVTVTGELNARLRKVEEHGIRVQL